MKEFFMKEAIKEAKKSGEDVPIGTVIVKDNKIIARAYNKKEKTKCAINHAEILAIQKASKKLGDFRLTDCEIYVTKEPCLMCVGAILSARIKKVYFGAFDKKYGAVNLFTDNNFNHKCEVEGGVLEKQNAEILSTFFQNLRLSKRGN